MVVPFGYSLLCSTNRVAVPFWETIRFPYWGGVPLTGQTALCSQAVGHTNREAVVVLHQCGVLLALGVGDGGAVGFPCAGLVRCQRLMGPAWKGPTPVSRRLPARLGGKPFDPGHPSALWLLMPWGGHGNRSLAT